MSEEALFQKLGKTFPPGTVLFKEGESGREMFVIQSGTVKISKVVRGEEQVLASLGPGEFFGEMAILNNKPRSATATVIEDCKMLVIDPKTYELMLKNNIEIAVRMIKKLAQRLQEADDQIESLLYKDANSRVVHTLTRAADASGKQTDGGIKVAMSAEDIASRTGMEPEQAREIIGRLEKAKLIKLQPDGIVISDANRLRKYLEYLSMKEQFEGAE
jgi:CRP/FNR family cyclic AMP-dependent transcriptional regulator